MRIDGVWKTLTDDSGDQEFFYFGAERNYDLFDVFCGDVDPDTGLTSRGFEPIAPRRGVPDDYPKMNPKTVLEYGYSWLTLRELIDFPWREKRRHFAGFADAENFRKFLENERFRFSPTQPKHPYSPDTFPKPEWNVVSNEEMLELILRATPVPENVFTDIEFSRGYDITGHGILSDTIPKLSEFGAPDDIRIVFWFSC